MLGVIGTQIHLQKHEGSVELGWGEHGGVIKSTLIMLVITIIFIINELYPKYIQSSR